MIVFEVTDKTGRKIRLPKKSWSHIRQKHPNVINSDDIKETIRHPLKAIHGKENIVVYYRHFKHRKEFAKYLKVIVKYLNGDGYAGKQKTANFNLQMDVLRNF